MMQNISLYEIIIDVVYSDLVSHSGRTGENFKMYTNQNQYNYYGYLSYFKIKTIAK